MKARIAVSILALIISTLFNPLALSASAQNISQLKRDFTEPFNAIIIENPRGSTEAQTWPSDTVRVLATFENPATSANPGSEILFDQPYAGALRIIAQGDAALNLTVYLPAHVSLSVRGGSRPVTVKGAMAGTSVETESGNITLHLPDDSNASLSARAFMGAIVSNFPVAIFGPIDAHILDGRIGAGGPPVILRSLRGQINLMSDAPSRLIGLSSHTPDNPEHSNPPPDHSNRDARAENTPLTDANVATNSFAPKRTADELPDVAAIKLETQLINLNVKVSDMSGKSITGLTKEDFLVFEDGQQQEITHFEPITAPVNLVLLLDLSGSTKKKMKEMKKAAKKFVESLNPNDRIAVAAFTRRFMVISNFTTDRKLLKDRIDDMNNRSGGTAYYDAMWATLNLFNEINETRKAIVVLTDGVDNSISDPDDYQPRHPFEELLARIAQEEATIYPIYFDTEYETVVKSGSGNHQEYVTARKQLQETADQTGGILFKADRVEDLEGAYQRVASELHSLYSMAYSTRNPKKDGKWRSINVKVNRDQTTARTRRGYYAK